MANKSVRKSTSKKVLSVLSPKKSSWGSRSPKPYILATVIILTIIAGYNRYVYPAMIEWSLPREKPHSPNPTPADQEHCEKLDGIWGPQGLAGPVACNLPTFDAGKPCYDSMDCQGSCLAEVSQQDVDDAGGVLKIKGTCSRYYIVGGCQFRVEKGNVYGMLCID